MKQTNEATCSREGIYVHMGLDMDMDMDIWTCTGNAVLEMYSLLQSITLSPFFFFFFFFFFFLFLDFFLPSLPLNPGRIDTSPLLVVSNWIHRQYFRASLIPTVGYEMICTQKERRNDFLLVLQKNYDRGLKRVCSTK